MKLKITFNDGLSGVLDFSQILTGDVFSGLKEQSRLLTASVAYGTVVWEGDVDLAPEYLHEQMIEQGVKLNRLTEVN